jgi:hypothetical protein
VFNLKKFLVWYTRAMKRFLKYFIFIVGGVFALIGIATTVVFIGMQYGAFNVRGSIIERNAFFGRVPQIQTANSIDGTSTIDSNGCKPPLPSTEPCDWNETVYWDVVKGGLEKDADIINRVAAETGVSARMIVAAVVPEQTRFFTDNRDVFKRYFEPLKLLGTMSKFSLGVSGIKQDTARQIEEFARSTTSPRYPGTDIAALLAYSTSTTDTDAELFLRLTDEKDHYYSYLYTAVFLREIIEEWRRAGYNIGERPDILVTLFNLGFQASAPKPNPQMGGAQITTGGASYSFGHLGTLFYQSDELAGLISSTTVEIN